MMRWNRLSRGNELHSTGQQGEVSQTSRSEGRSKLQIHLLLVDGISVATVAPKQAGIERMEKIGWSQFQLVR